MSSNGILRTAFNRAGCVLALVAIAACSRGASDTKPADTLTTTTASIATTATPFFEVLGHHAENAYDYVKIADWSKARASVDSLKAAMQHAPAQDTAGYGTDTRQALARLDTAVARRSRVEGMREANHLTELGALLAASHDTAVPAAVTLLDYYGRELEIWADARDVEKLSQAAAGIKKAWNEVRPRVVARGGTAEAASFDSVVAQVTAARTPAQYSKTATPLLDRVDVLEGVFTR